MTAGNDEVEGWGWVYNHKQDWSDSGPAYLWFKQSRKQYTTSMNVRGSNLHAHLHDGVGPNTSFYG
jgi:hypothetical protein